jgi:hypothetical protein
MTISNANQTLAAVNRWKYTSTGGETSLSGLDDNGNTLSYQLGTEQLHLNGILLVRGVDYVATTGSSITGLIALIAGDVIDIVSTVSTVISGMVPLSTVTAKGDLIAASSSGTVTNLSVGADGTTLVANSASATGVAWAGPTFTAGKNKIINGDFGIWQRGTSFALPAGIETYTADRFIVFADGTLSCTVSRQAFTPGTAPVAGYESAYFMRTLITSQSGGSGAYNYQKIEDVRTYAGQTVTMSFFAKADSARTVNVYLSQNFGSGGSATVNSTATPMSVTTSWQRFTYTVTLGSLSGKTIGTNSFLTAYLSFAANTAQTIDTWGVQVEAGSVATSFQTATGTLQGELAACQRYYTRFSGSTAYNSFGVGQGKTTTVASLVIPLPVQMRTDISTLDYSTVGVYDGANIYNASSATINTGQTGNKSVYVEFTTTGLTQYRPYVGLFQNNSSGYIGFSAEL